ncbi:MAG: hypothetical protein ACOCQR_03830 [bacterium]
MKVKSFINIVDKTVSSVKQDIYAKREEYNLGEISDEFFTSIITDRCCKHLYHGLDTERLLIVFREKPELLSMRLDDHGIDLEEVVFPYEILIKIAVKEILKYIDANRIMKDIKEAIS